MCAFAPSSFTLDLWSVISRSIKFILRIKLYRIFLRCIYKSWEWFSWKRFDCTSAASNFRNDRFQIDLLPTFYDRTFEIKSIWLHDETLITFCVIILYHAWLRTTFARGLPDLRSNMIGISLSNWEIKTKIAASKRQRKGIEKKQSLNEIKWNIIFSESWKSLTSGKLRHFWHMRYHF